MTQEDWKTFEDMLRKQTGPFTEYRKDIAILPKVLDWIGDDWDRFRMVLNFVHDAGIVVAGKLIQTGTSSAKFRMKTERLAKEIANGRKDE